MSSEFGRSRAGSFGRRKTSRTPIRLRSLLTPPGSACLAAIPQFLAKAFD